MGAFDYFRTQIAALPDDVKRQVGLEEPSTVPQASADSSDDDTGPPQPVTPPNTGQQTAGTGTNPAGTASSDSEEDDLPPPSWSVIEEMFHELFDLDDNDVAFSFFQVIWRTMNEFNQWFSKVYPYLNQVDSSHFNKENMNELEFTAAWSAMQIEKKTEEQERSIKQRIYEFEAQFNESSAPDEFIEQLPELVISSIRQELLIATELSGMTGFEAPDEFTLVAEVLHAHDSGKSKEEQLTNLMKLSEIKWCFAGQLFHAFKDNIEEYLE